MFEIRKDAAERRCYAVFLQKTMRDAAERMLRVASAEIDADSADFFTDSTYDTLESEMTTALELFTAVHEDDFVTFCEIAEREHLNLDCC